LPEFAYQTVIQNHIFCMAWLLFFCWFAGNDFLRHLEKSPRKKLEAPALVCIHRAHCALHYAWMKGDLFHFPGI